MKTYGLKEAAEILKCHFLTVARLARSGELPGRKVGRRWVFLEADIANVIRNGNNKSCLPVPSRGKGKKWHFINEGTPIGSVLQRRAEKELDALLTPKKRGRRNSS